MGNWRAEEVETPRAEVLDFSLHFEDQILVYFTAMTNSLS